MSVTGIGNVGSNYYTQQISSGKRINSAADDASGLAISEKLRQESNSQNVTADNDKAGINAMNIADGALGGINDYLERIKELSVKASNGVLGKDDKQAIQDEINQYIEGIDQLSGNAQYNTKPLLDGSSMSIAVNPDGTGINVGVGKLSSETLGLKGYSVMGDFDMNIIDKAISTVSGMRSNAGSNTNALEYAYNYSRISEEQLTGSLSRTEDADIAKAISQQKKESLMEQYRLLAQKKKSEDDGIVNKMLFGI